MTAEPLPLAAEADIANLTAQLEQALRATFPRILDTVENVVHQVIADVTASVITGDATRLQAAQTALDRLLGRGITGYVDTAGRNWDLRAYLSMAVRTAAAKAAVDGHLDQLTAKGLDLVIVQAGPRHCPICQEWDGKILSISGVVAGLIFAPNPATGSMTSVTVKASVADARAAGWGHPNCRCSLSAYLPGITKRARPAYDQGEYEATQRQRGIEREIRAWKQRQATAVTPDAKREAAAKVREWQAALRGLLADDPGLRRQSPREQIGAAH